jgi:hypothetical protein
VAEENENWKVAALLAVAALFIASTFLAWRELKFAVSGKSTAATVDRVTHIGARGSRRSLRGASLSTVEYHYPDAAGALHHGSYDIEFPDTTPPVGSAVMVDYVGDTSRRTGHRNGGALMIFFGTLIALVVGGVLLGRVYTVPKRY